MAGALGTAVVLGGSASAESSPYLGPCALVASKDAKTLYVALAEARQVAWVELPAGKVVRRLDVPAEPTGLALTPDGSTLAVTCAAPISTVLVVDARSGAASAAIRAGHTAMGPAIAPDASRLYVCNRFNNDVSVIDLATGREAARVPAVREPVAAAVTPDGRTVLVANHLPNDAIGVYPLSAMVTVIDAQTLATSAIRLAHGSHSLRGLCVSPDGKYAYATHVLANFELIPTQVEMGWMSINAVSVIDVAQRKVINTLGLDESYLAAGNPWGVTATADGKAICVTHAGTDDVTLVDAAAAAGPLVHVYVSGAAGAVLDDPQSDRPLRRRVRLPGKGPRGLALAGSMLYAAEYFTDTLAVVDLGARSETAAGQIALGPTPEWTPQRRGEVLFNDATICRQQWQSCASCHPDGRAEALNWDLVNDGVGNPKNTKSMILAHETPPAMFEGVRPTAAAAVRAGLENILFAYRPEEEAAAIDAYLRSLKPVPSPRLVDGRLSPAAERGKRLFESHEVGCAKCHPAPWYTDRKMHNVGTQGPYEPASRFDTPTLIEVWRTAPYLHDGRYLTVKELLIQGKHGASLGRLESMSQQEIDDLVEFVLSL